MPEQKKKSPVVPVVAAVVAAIVLGVTLVAPALSSGGDETERAATTHRQESGEAPDDTWNRLVRRTPDDPMARGEVDAPVVMIAYSEFQCPFCGKFARDTEPALVEKYVQDGTLRIEWRDFPYLGKESMTAARAGRAAAEQDRFWEFHEAMYADQPPPNTGAIDAGYVTGVAREVGLDVDRFRRDLEAPATERAVQRDFSEGQAIGVSGTPTFVVNGTPIVGAQPQQAFEQVIEEAAAEAGS